MTTVRPPAWYQDFRKQLLSWYRKHHRDLPWRATQDPYAIWVSETMLQQTQVATVIDYYHRFLKKFPTVAHLAAAQQDEVLHLWSGLGYYRRARSLHTAAQQVVAQFDGQMPSNVELLQSLAGIGRYTAGAIASFAYDQRAPILEANTIRLFSRLIGLREAPSSSSAQAQLWKFAEDILPLRSGSSTVNQAVMELGSLVCVPVSPKCLECPLSQHCRAHEQGIENQIPLSKPKLIAEPLTHAGVIIRNSQGEILLRQNGKGQWWDGLWDLPWVVLVEQKRFNLCPSKQLEIASTFLTQLELNCDIGDLMYTVRHAVTKYKIRYFCLDGKLRIRRLPKLGNWGWFAQSALPPVATRFKRIHWDSLG